MPRNTTPFLLNLTPSEIDEPDITNDEFLDSLAGIGVWLRVLSAYDSLARYASPDASPAQRLAALSNIFLQLGAQAEDQAVALIAFSVWSTNRDLVLADLFSRIFVRRPRNPTKGSHVEEVHAKLKSGGDAGVPVDQASFFREVAAMNDAAIVEFCLGYRWRTVPSVKLIPKRHIEVWRRMPGELRRIASSFYDERHFPRVTAGYNKLKHGPQLVIQNPMDRGRQFGTAPNLTAQLARFESFDKPTVRLLFAGASTQREPTAGNGRSVAPFLIDDLGAANKLYFETMVHHASLFSLMVKMQIALYRKEEVELGETDAGIIRIVEAMGRYQASR